MDKQNPQGIVRPSTIQMVNTFDGPMFATQSNVKSASRLANNADLPAASSATGAQSAEDSALSYASPDRLALNTHNNNTNLITIHNSSSKDGPGGVFNH